MIIFLISGMSTVMHIAEGFHYPVAITSAFALACAFGMLLGRRAIPVYSVCNCTKGLCFNGFCCRNLWLLRLLI